MPESQLRMLPEELERTRRDRARLRHRLRVGLARPPRRARRSGSTTREAQLATARASRSELGLDFPLLHGNAEQVPLPDASFDFAISEYGASIWCDPYKWIPEAARLLRPGGRLVFLVNAVLLMLCAPDEDDVPAGDASCCARYFGMHRFEWPDDDSVEFHLPHGELIGCCVRTTSRWRS